MKIRVMSANIWGDYFGNPVQEREGQLEAVIRRYSPDILGMQEATPAWNASAAFASLGDTYAFVSGDGFPENNYVPLLYRKSVFSLLECGFVRYTDTPDRSKAATWALLAHKASGERIGAMCTHFWWKCFGTPEHDALRVSNAAVLTETAGQIARRTGAPIVAMGDLNSTPGVPSMRYLREAGWRFVRDEAPLTSETSTHHGDPQRGGDGRYHGSRTGNRWDRSIDHIFTLGALRPLSFSVIEDQDALDESDHSPVLCELET